VAASHAADGAENSPVGCCDLGRANVFENRAARPIWVARNRSAMDQLVSTSKCAIFCRAARMAARTPSSSCGMIYVIL
jgi:hypothetical protein